MAPPINKFRPVGIQIPEHSSFTLGGSEGAYEGTGENFSPPGSVESYKQPCDDIPGLAAPCQTSPGRGVDNLRLTLRKLESCSRSMEREAISTGHMREPSFAPSVGLTKLQVGAEHGGEREDEDGGADSPFAYVGNTGDPVSPHGHVKELVTFFHLTEVRNSPRNSPPQSPASGGSPHTPRFGLKSGGNLDTSPTSGTNDKGDLDERKIQEMMFDQGGKWGDREERRDRDGCRADSMEEMEFSGEGEVEGVEDGRMSREEDEGAKPGEEQENENAAVMARMFRAPFPAAVQIAGRHDDLQAIFGLLHLTGTSEKGGASSSCRAFAGICGAGGQGKTQLALAYCHQHWKDYRGGVLWVNAGYGWEESFAALGPLLGLSVDEAGRSMLADRVRAVRTALEEGGHLLVLDNVSRRGEGLEEMLPKRGDIHVLITTRAKSLSFMGVPSHELKNLSVDNAHKMLAFRRNGEKRVLTEVDDMSLVYVAKAINCLPFALSVAVSLLDAGVGPREILERVRKEPMAMPDDIQSTTRIFVKPSSIRQLLDLAVERLEGGRTVNPCGRLALAMLETAAWLGVTPIPLSFLTLVGRRHSGQNDSEATGEEAVAALQLMGFAEIVGAPGDTDEPYISVSPVLQAYGQLRAPGRQGAAGTVLSTLAAGWCNPLTMPLCQAVWERRRELQESGNDVGHILRVGLHLASHWARMGWETQALGVCDEVLSGHGSFHLSEMERENCLVDALREMEEARWQRPGQPVPQMRWRFQLLRADIFQQLTLDPTRADEQLRMCYDGMDDDLKSSVPGFLVLSTRAAYMMRHFPAEDQARDGDEHMSVWDVGRHEADSMEAADSLQLAAQAKSVLVFSGLWGMGARALWEPTEQCGNYEEYWAVNDNQRQLGTGLMSLASCFYDNGHVKTAMEIYSQALFLRRSVLPIHHPDLVLSYQELAGVLLELHRRAETLEWLQETAALLEHEIQESPILRPIFNDAQPSVESEVGSPLSSDSPPWDSPRSTSVDSCDFRSSHSAMGAAAAISRKAVTERGLPLASAVGLVRKQLYERARLEEDIVELLKDTCLPTGDVDMPGSPIAALSVLEVAVDARHNGHSNAGLAAAVLRLLPVATHARPPCLPEVQKILEKHVDDETPIPPMRDMSPSDSDSHSSSSSSSTPSTGDMWRSLEEARREGLFSKGMAASLWALGSVYRVWALSPGVGGEPWLREAQEVLLQALDAAQRSVPSEAETVVGGILIDLALVCMQQGEFREAQEYLERALVLWEACYGTDTPKSGDVMALLAVVQFRQAQQAFAGSTPGVEKDKVWEKDRMLALTKVLVYIGRVLLAGDRGPDALVTLGKALAIREHLLPEMHRDIVESLLDLGSTVARQGRDGNMASERDLMIDTLGRMGITLLDAGRVNDAERCMQMLLVLRQQMSPDEYEPDQEQQIAESLLDTAHRMERRKCSSAQEQAQTRSVAKEMKKEALLILSKSVQAQSTARESNSSKNLHHFSGLGSVLLRQWSGAGSRSNPTPPVQPSHRTSPRL